MKHLSKKVLIIIVVIAIIATATVVFFACQPKPAATPPPKNGHTVSMAPPEDGTSPEDYDGLENLAYMAGRLSARTYFHSENTGLVDTIAKQNVVGTKDYYNGILITQSVSTSAFASVAQQKFYGDGKVVVRGPRYDKGKWNGIHTEWSNDKPVSVLDEAQYLEAYGLWADEFSDYVLNAETVSDVSDLARDENGNFVQTFTLDPAGSTYYYKRQMRTMGNLGDYPSFSSVQITFTFDDTWSVLRADIEEEYKVSVSVLNVSCKATSSIVYTYEESAVDVSAYESYFKNYADAPVTGGGETPLTVVDYLQQGFAGYLAEPSTFDLKIAVNGDTVAGRVTLDLANGLEIRASLGDLLLNVESDSLYVQYKELTGKLALSDLISLAGGGFAGVDPDKLMEQLASGSISKDGENVTIECALDLAGLHLPLTFRFLETESGVSFVDVSAALRFDPIDIGASFAPAKGADAVAKIDASKAVDLKPYVDSIFEIVNSKSFTLALGYDNADLGLSVSGELYIDALRPALRGEIFIAYAGLDIPVRFTFIDETVYLQVFEIKLKTSQEYLVEALEAALRAADVTLPDLGALDLKAAISAVITADYDSIIQKLRLTDEKLSLVVDLDAFIADMNLGELSANFMPAENAFGLSVYGVTAKMQGVTAREAGAPADADDYVSLELFEKFIEPVQNLVKSDDIAIALEFGAKIHDVEMTVALSVEIKHIGQDMQAYLKAEIFVDGFADEVIELTYRDDYVTLVYEGKMMRVPVSQLQQIAQKLGGLFASKGETADQGLQAAILLFSEDGIDLQAFLESLCLSGRTEEEKTILGLFADLGLLDERLSETRIEISTDGQKLSAGLVGGTVVFGLPVNMLEVSLWPAADEFPYDFSGAEECGNVFEFALNAYVALFDTKYLNVSAQYDSELLQANVSGLFEFVPASDTGTELSINFDLRAEIHTFALNDAAEKIDAGSHYLNMTAVGETAYVSYSLSGYNADTALYVSIPVEQLYKIGNMLLPIMGLDANAPYYDLIDHLLSAGETQFTTGIFSAIQFADLLKLLDGIPQAQGVSADGVAALSENLSLFAVGANENGDISFTLSGLSVGNGETLSLSFTAQRAGEIAVDTSKTYIDISSVSLLFEDLLNAYQYTDTGYELKGSLGLSLLGIDLDLTVNIELKVGVETDGTPYLNVNLKTNGYNNILVLAIFGTQVVTNGDTETDITFKDGSIYMTRVQSTSWQKKNWISYAFLPITPEYQYRKMSLEEFAGDAMDQIFFAINLSDGAKSYISKQINSSDGGSGTTKDAGEMVKGYSFADDVHTLKLDVGAIAGDSALGELTLNITRARLEGKDYYDLVKLDGTMILVSVITMKFDLTHQSCGNAVDFTVIDENISRVNANVA